MPRIRVDFEELDLDTLAILEEAGRGKTVGVAEMRALAAAFLVDEEDRPLPREQALAQAGRLKLREVKAIFVDAGAAMRGVQERAVPKATSSS